MTWTKGLVDLSQPVISADRSQGDVIIGHQAMVDYPSGSCVLTKDRIGIVMRASDILGYTYHSTGFPDSYCFTNYGGREEVVRRVLGHEPTLQDIKASFSWVKR